MKGPGTELPHLGQAEEQGLGAFICVCVGSFQTHPQRQPVAPTPLAGVSLPEHLLPPPRPTLPYPTHTPCPSNLSVNVFCLWPS